MTREEEIREAIKTLQVYVCGDNGIFECSECIDSDIQNAFYQGVKWADKHPKSPWISVKDDLPCNHEEMVQTDFTDRVLVLIRNGCPELEVANMCVIEGKWEWNNLITVSYWMPIPKLPKE